MGHTSLVIRFEMFFGLVVLALWIYSLVDCVGSDEGAIRNLPKLWWLLIVLFFPFAGSVAWLVAGRPQALPARAHERAAPAFPEYDRPGRVAATDPDDDEAFLNQVRERAEQQRQTYREQQRRQQPPPATED